MPWIVIDAETKALVSGPHADAPEVDEGRESWPAPPEFPALMFWDPVALAFRDIVPLTGRILSPLAYQRRFTQAERIAIRGSADPAVIDWHALAMIATEIDLTDPDVVAGTNYLEAIGLIGAGRAAEILTI
ncbi:hypothetical protein [Sphingomonas fennica]|uniref:Uncharacterized protein n=1 Tax=Edaphosphingomonas fennica TaxID=114404 RepID=A0A2T4HVV9_9SPHN|nr:hypothetical protein [Sphingomonas fennica]PTD19890.1 hypothetical protein CV103_11925 [Sphingomonas fennica]